MRKSLKTNLKRAKNHRKKLLIALVLLILGSYYFYHRQSQSQSDPVTQTAEVQKGTIVSSITASGNIISSHLENVTTQASGTVKKVYVSDGDQVYAGQKLAEISLDLEGKQNLASAYSTYLSAVVGVNSANNSYRSSQASLAVVYDEIQGHDTDETLAMKETRTRAEVANDNAYDGLGTAQARLSVASLTYQSSSPVITAPAAGIIKSVTIAEGMNIGASETASGSRANQRIATISTVGLPIATFNLSEIDVVTVKPGQKATITLDAITDKTFTGKVVSVDRVGTTTNNVTTYPVIIEFDINSESILPNMAATANIILETKSDILIISSSAINYQNNATTVSVLRNGQEITQSVEVGLSNDTQTEIISGLSDGDVVITNSQSTSTQTSTTRSSGNFFLNSGPGMR